MFLIVFEICAETETGRRDVQLPDDGGAGRLGAAGTYAEAADSERARSAGPTPNRDAMDRQRTFRHHFLQVAVARHVAQIPSHPQNDNHFVQAVPA